MATGPKTEAQATARRRGRPSDDRVRVTARLTPEAYATLQDERWNRRMETEQDLFSEILEAYAQNARK